jgi:hypothetical protein
MKIYFYDLEPDEDRYCEVGAVRNPYSWELSLGEPATALMKERGDKAMRLNLDEATGGLDLPDAVANTSNLLVLRKRCADPILGAFELGDHEALPVVLINSKGRVHAKDYVVVNPFGHVDCLDMERSEMDGDEDDPTVRIFGKFWLDAARVPTDRDLFRVRGVGTGYMLSERLVAFIREQGFTNFVLHEVQLS